MTTSRLQHSAEPGDLIVIEGHHVGDRRRTGEILEVLAGVETEHYRVRWEDGAETIFYPGSSDATIKPRKARRQTTKRKQGSEELEIDEPVLLHEP